MRLGVIADVHGNLGALLGAVRSLDTWGVDDILCAGDLVGYNAEPDEVVRMLSQRATCVAGNHDRIAHGALSLDGVWRPAAHALSRTRATIDERTRVYLEALPTLKIVGPDVGGIAVFHGFVEHVTRRTKNSADILACHDSLLARGLAPWLVVYGHTHRRALHRVIDGPGGPRVVTMPHSLRTALCRGETWYLNPGSVDGARRGEGSSEFALVNTETRTLTFGRATYDHEASERRARSRGFRLPWAQLLRLRLDERLADVSRALRAVLANPSGASRLSFSTDARGRRLG